MMVAAGDNKVLHISKGCNGQLVVPNDNGTPDDPSDDYTENKKSSSWGVSTKTFVTAAEENANVAVFEAKILAKNVTANAGIQLRLYGKSTSAANCPAQFFFDTLSLKLIHEEPHEHTPAEAVVENNIPATCTSQGSYDEVVFAPSAAMSFREALIPLHSLTTLTLMASACAVQRIPRM